jgi:hypothetical protein
MRPVSDRIAHVARSPGVAKTSEIEFDIAVAVTEQVDGGGKRCELRGDSGGGLRHLEHE